MSFCPFDKRLNGGSEKLHDRWRGLQAGEHQDVGLPRPGPHGQWARSPERGWGDADAFHPGRESISSGPGSRVLRRLFGLAAEKAHKKALKYVNFS